LESEISAPFPTGSRGSSPAGGPIGSVADDRASDENRSPHFGDLERSSPSKGRTSDDVETFSDRPSVETVSEEDEDSANTDDAPSSTPFSGEEESCSPGGSISSPWQEEEEGDGNSQLSPDEEVVYPSSVDTNRPDFDLGNPELDIVLTMRQGCTLREAILLEVASNIRHKETYESLMDHFRNLNTILDFNYFPTSKGSFWRLLKQNPSSVQKHVYCSECYRYLGLSPAKNDSFTCRCGLKVYFKDIKYFVSLSLTKQLRRFLEGDGSDAWNCLQYRDCREKLNVNNLEDILDGYLYQELRRQAGDNDFTYNFFTDGVKPFFSSETTVWPIFARLK